MPLTAPATVGGPVTLKFYLTDPLQPEWQAGFNPRISLEIDIIDSNDELLLPVASGEWTVCNTVNGANVCTTGPQPVGGNYAVEIPAVTLPAGGLLAQWRTALDTSGLPPAAISGIRVYERYFYLTH